MLAELLVTLRTEPLLLALALFLATFVLEDAATIVAGILTATAGADWTIALPALISGTITGDLALYAAGRWGGDTTLGRRLGSRTDVMRAERWIGDRALSLVFVARFLPGSRLPVFTASGMVGAPFGAVAAIVAVTTPIWTGGLFSAAHFAGQAGAEQFLTVAVPVSVTVTGAILLLQRSGRRWQAGI
jgi:membrane protein DedA with SNARE-associated domain